METAKECLLNGQNLLEDAEGTKPSTSVALASVAQEEFAKGFLLTLVARGLIPWNSLVKRMSNDHICKQLLAIVMEFLYEKGEWFFSPEFMKLPEEQRYARLPIPSDVLDALDIIRNERVYKMEHGYRPYWEPPPEYNKKPLEIHRGKRERKRQDSLYVRISGNGRVGSSPRQIKESVSVIVQEQAKRLEDVLRGHIGEIEAATLVDLAHLRDPIIVLFESLRNSRTVKGK